uniref:Glycosyltransferase 2-like domain-containing protein n=1 Tax=viral metagenome TaxID=1070528 RepID=A0A6C0CHB5_9ZZZZ
MKVNIISNYKPNTGLMQDTGILRGILSAAYGENVQIFRVHYMQPECAEADMNIFMEVVNPSLFSYAGMNVWIPNPEWTRQTWIPYIQQFDEIWAKTQECYDIFSKYTQKLKLIGWTSIDKVWNPNTDKKNFYKAVVPVGKNLYRHPKPILQAYQRILKNDPDVFRKLPTLNIVYSEKDIEIYVPEDIQSKVVLHSKVLKESEYDELVRDCGLCICLSACEGFCHVLNECMSAGCNLLISPIRPFTEDLVGLNRPGAFYTEQLKSIDHPDCLGKLMDVKVESVIEALEKYVATEYKQKRWGSIVMRETYEKRHKVWVESMTKMLKEIPIPSYCLKDTMPKEDTLPDVSIVTITKDRRKFMPLAKYCYMIQSYPEDKLEWVIVDDGDDPIEDTLIGVPNVKYVKCDRKMTIAEKRNLGVENAMYDIIAMMDDDDVYPNNSILQRTAMMLKEPSKECGFCTTIPCYDITKYTSFMNVPPLSLPQSKRVSEATLIFTKKFWEERKFEDKVQIAEGDTFIHDREKMCRELSPQEVIVSLVHPLNTSSRKAPEMESNGCHYGFNEDLFALVSQIGEDLKNPSSA